MKIGDKVECINGVCGYKLGAIGIIKKIREDGDLCIDFAKQKGYGWANSKNYRLLKEEVMWDDKTVEAIKKSVVHWDEVFDSIVKCEEYRYGAKYCALCRLFGGHCKKCPLSIRGLKCDDDYSPFNIFDDDNSSENARNMLLALKSLFYPEEEKKEVFYSIGQRFITDSGDEHILARTDCDVVVLIGLDDGNRWIEPIKVNSSTKITESEFKKICGGDTFTLKESK